MDIKISIIDICYANTAPIPKTLKGRSVRLIEEKSCNFCSFVSIFMKSHTMIEKTLSEHIIMIIMHFLFKNVVFEQK